MGELLVWRGKGERQTHPDEVVRDVVRSVAVTRLSDITTDPLAL